MLRIRKKRANDSACQNEILVKYIIIQIGHLLCSTLLDLLILFIGILMLY